MRSNSCFTLVRFFVFFFCTINFNGHSSSSTPEEHSTAKKGNQLSFDALLKLIPEECYQGSIVQDNRAPAFIERTTRLFTKAKILYAEDKRQAIQIYKDLALTGHVESMSELGKICHERRNFHTSLRWYVLAFQVDWLITGQHNVLVNKSFEDLRQEPALKKIKDLMNFFTLFKQFLRHHPLNKHKDPTTLLTLDVIYEQQKLEPHLTPEERIKKSKWFNTYYLDHFAPPEELLSEGNKCFNEKRFGRAISLWKRSALPHALFNVAKTYEDGLFGRINGKPDYEEAARLYRALNTPEALCNLGYLYVIGAVGLKSSGTPDYEEAAHFLRLTDIPDAAFNLGYMHHFGMIGLKDDHTPNYEEAARLYQKADVPQALCNLGNLYRDGLIGLIDGRPDYQTAERFYLLSKHPNALWNRGRLYRDGHLKLKDNTNLYEFVASCFREANHDEAKCDLANLYAGGRIGLKNGKPDIEKAIDLYRTSKTPEAFLNIGLMYLRGEIEATNNNPHYLKAFISFKASKTLMGKFMQLLILEYHYEEVATLFQKSDQEKAIIALCEQLKEDLKTAKPDEKEFIVALFAYYLDKDFEKALIHFNNAFALGNREAQVYIQIMQDRMKSKEKDTFNDLDQAPIELQPEKKPKNFEAQKEDKQLSLSPPIETVAQLEVITKREPVGEMARVDERPKQYKPVKSILSRVEKAQKIFEKIRKKFIGSYHPDANEKDEKKFIPPLTIKFIDENIKATYEALDLTKMRELLEYIEAKPYGTEGTGQPEVLKGKYKGFKGCISRRINEVDRLVYKVTGAREILILSCQGHY